MDSSSKWSLEPNSSNQIDGLNGRRPMQRTSGQAQSSKFDNQSDLRSALNLQSRRSNQCGEKVLRFASDMIRQAATNASDALGNKMNDLTAGFITPADFNRAINRIIPPPLPQGGPSPRDPFRDADFTRITELLKLHGKSEWSKRPRTFTLLRMTGSTEAIEAFIADHLSDLSLPYTEQNLPNAIKGAQARARFLDLQNLVKTHAADLENGANHMYFPQNANDYFQSLKELGEGGFGQVDHVWSRLSLRDFARKRIPRGRSFKSDKAAIANFEKELGTLKLLSHQHLVRLIGSYTDPKFVGLIMHPVADMNLATYFNQMMDIRERQICLRRFYGCLASAVLYLHDQKIRHKDIKPSNVLVRGSDVYLTDFGTSMHWDDGSQSTTMGTVPARTPKYCPPEVWNQEERSTSSDIWCLGCCFLEMTTVLNNRTTKDMDNFLGSHGTRSKFFHANEEATNMWIEALKKDSENCDDIVPLVELIPWMIARLPKDRPTSHQVVNCILNFETQRTFYGVCCGNDEVTVQSANEDYSPSYAESSFNEQSKKSPTMSDEILTVIAQSTTSGPGPKDPGDSCLGQSRLLNAPTSSNDQGKQTNKYVPHECDGGKVSASSNKNTAATLYHSVFDFFGLMNRSAIPSILYCQWPACPSTREGNYFTSKEHIEKHYRSIHETHEFSWSSLLISEVIIRSSTTSRVRKASLNSMTAVLVQNENREYTGPSSAWESDNSETESPLGPMSNPRKSNLSTQAKSIKTYTPQTGLSGVKEGSSRSQPQNNLLPEGRQSKAHLIVSSSDKPRTRRTSFVHGDSHQDEKHLSPRKPKNVRFNLLPNERRPEPTAAPAPEENAEPDRYKYIAAEPLSLPSIGIGEENIARVLPNSSSVPSYVLAGTNRFTSAEIDTLVPRSTSSLLQPPLFVYGSFMFPSIVKAQARKSIKGIYSSQHQRRLVPDPIDWARASRSLKHVAEIMTPAVLKGYDRWKPKGLECATIVNSRTTTAILATKGFSMPKRFRNLLDQEIFPGHVQGFLLFGFSEEVFKTCDEIFPLDHDRIKSETDAAGRIEERYFRRKTVKVDIQLSNGRLRSLEAVTYVWASATAWVRLEGPWDINDFIKRPCFNRWSLAQPGDDPWATEEAEIAKAMKMTYVLAGDALGHAISKGDLEAITELLEGGDDINGACRPHGTPLQTAVVDGNETLVHLLLKKGADVNIKSGQYQTALLASVLCGHEEIVALLLRRKADVLTECGFYVSALYQAVSHSDESIVYLLLEHGAWLGTGYAEILDLAAERGNHRIKDMLIEYDVRKLHLALPIYQGSLEERGQHMSKGQETASTSGNVLRAVITQALVLKGSNSNGRWQGRRGVLVLRAALEAGAPERVVDEIGDNLTTISRLIDFFTTVTRKAESGDYFRADIEECDSSSDENSTVGGDDDDDDDATLIGKERTYDEAMTTDPGRTPDKRRQPPERAPLAGPRTRLSKPNANRPVRVHSDTSGGPLLKAPRSGQRDRKHSESARDTCLSKQPSPRHKRKLCWECNGRGGRQGTGWPCTDCQGARNSRCNACQGTGLIFSNRDRCRKCGGSRYLYG